MGNMVLEDLPLFSPLAASVFFSSRDSPRTPPLDAPLIAPRKLICDDQGPRFHPKCEAPCPEFDVASWRCGSLLLAGEISSQQCHNGLMCQLGQGDQMQICVLLDL